MGVKLARGRSFTEQDETGHASIAVISYNYWTQRFSRNPDVLGRTFYVNGVPLTMVGIAAEGFEGVEAGSSTDFWIPLQGRAELNAWGNPLEDGKTYRENATWWCLRMLGRLAPGVTKAQAVAQLQSTFQTAAYVGLGDPEPGEKRPVLSLQDAKNFPGYDGMYGKPLRMLMAMVGLVLLIALTNVVMLLMARNATRQREFSLRMALGARRGELLGLQWTDLQGTQLMIGRSLSQVGQQVFLKEPKNKKFRVITIPPTALKKMQAHRKAQQPYRDHFGASYQGDYIFCNPDGSPLKPDTISASVSLLFRTLKLPKGASLHTLRHTHGSHLGGRRAADRR